MEEGKKEYERVETRYVDVAEKREVRATGACECDQGRNVRGLSDG